MSTDRVISLVSEDGDLFVVSFDVMKLSGFIVTQINEEGKDEILLSKVSSSTLIKIIEYCEHYKIDPMKEIEKSLNASNIHEIVNEWYASFVSIEQKELFDLIVGAASLDIKPLLDLANTTVALMIKGKSPEEIRSQFNIRNDLTPEEEEQVRLQNKKEEEED
eukprot:gene3439-3665_t